jgi:hypothetical protein
LDFKEAVLSCWTLREEAARQARAHGNQDPGLRAGVTGGGHLDPLAELVKDVLVDAGIPAKEINCARSNLELPGYFRAEKKWDVVVVHEGEFVAAIEFKSILGSFGNNMNNRTEEALGNATDVLHAAEIGLLGLQPPWLGYVFLMQDEAASRSPVRVKEPHFEVDREFQGASYQRRAMLLCRRLLMKRLYDAAWFVLGEPEKGVVSEPAADLAWVKFEAALRGRVGEILA